MKQFKLSYMYFFGIFAFPLLINIHFFEISEMTTHPTMTPTFESAMLSFSPGVNSRAELVTLASSGKTSGLNLTQIGSNRDLDPGQYATDASWVKLTQILWSTYLTRNSGSIFNPEYGLILTYNKVKINPSSGH